MNKTESLYYMIPRIIEKWEKIKDLDPNSCLYDDEWVRRMTGTFSLYTQCCVAILEYELHYLQWRNQVFSPLSDAICYGSFGKLQEIAEEIARNCITLRPCNAPIAFPILLSYHNSEDKKKSVYSLIPNYDVQIIDYRSNITHIAYQFPKEDIEHMGLFNKAVQSLDVKRLQMDVVRSILDYAQMFYCGIQDYNIIRKGNRINVSGVVQNQIMKSMSVLKNDMSNLLKRQIELIEEEYTKKINYVSLSFVTPSSYSNKQYWRDEMNLLLQSMAQFDKIFVESKKTISIVKSEIIIDTEKLVQQFYHNEKAEEFFPLFSKYYYLFSLINNSNPHIKEGNVTIHNTDKQDCDVYISYNWENGSNNAVNHLSTILQYNGIKYKRDKLNCTYRDNIKNFMTSLRHGKKIILFLSKQYLESPNCMYELSGVIESPDYKERLFPIVVDASIRDDSYYVQLVHHWHERIDKLKREITDIEGMSEKQTKPLEEKMEENKKVFELLSEIKSYIDYTNSPSYDQMSETNFKDLLEIITD